MIRYLRLLVLFIGMQQTVFSQIDSAKEDFRVNALALDQSTLSERYPIKLSPIVGLTDKGFAITMDIKPIDGFAKKEYGITI